MAFTCHKHPALPPTAFTCPQHTPSRLNTKSPQAYPSPRPYATCISLTPNSTLSFPMGTGSPNNLQQRNSLRAPAPASASALAGPAISSPMALLSSPRQSAAAQVDGSADLRPEMMQRGLRAQGAAVQSYGGNSRVASRRSTTNRIAATASATTPPAISRSTQNKPHEPSAVDLLPWCSSRSPLGEDQAVALSDVVGDLRELVLLAAGAGAGVSECLEKLEDAVGGLAAAGIVEFFAHEWEVE